jgi:tRNA nucleotidyltransferase (CCA-adding enzyme)
MQVYLVGGAVRDELLGRPVKERDWVVVGATPAEMERLGYRAVGREFPVFLHPETKEEYALARLERKTGPGYRGFITEYSPAVTLEQDLQRRDLTINAMARGTDNALIDPYGGRDDLARRQLRHVSPAFGEDPVRVLRVARFAARFAELGFTVADATRALMRTMVDQGEVAALVPERVWREMERALGEPTPELFFDTLADCGALPVVLPGLCWSEPDRAALRAATVLSADESVRFAALAAGSPLAAIVTLCQRLRVPSRFSELATLSARWHERLAQADALDAPAMLDLLEAVDALRRPERFERLLQSCAARGTAAATLTLLRVAAASAAAAAIEPERMRSMPGPAIASALRELRITRLAALPQLQSMRRRS